MNLRSIRTALVSAFVAAAVAVGVTSIASNPVTVGAADTGAEFEAYTVPWRVAVANVGANQLRSIFIPPTNPVGAPIGCITAASVNLTWAAAGPGYVSVARGMATPNMNTSVLNATAPGQIVANNVTIATGQLTAGNGFPTGPQFFNLRPTAAGTFYVDIMGLYTVC